MIKATRGRILNCAVDLCDYTQAMERIRGMIQSAQAHQVVTLNPEMVQYAQKNLCFRDLINRADLITADGVSIVWAAKKRGYSLRERVTGIDLAGRICCAAAAEGWKVYFLGSAPGVAAAAANGLQRQYPGFTACGWHDGYFSAAEEAAVIQSIRTTQPDVLLVGLGSPRQECWIARHKDNLRIPVSIGVGGSFDVISGRKRRAPGWMITLRAEWLYRLLSEPKRIKRYVQLPRFVFQVLKDKPTDQEGTIR
jgi:N-acetylglucosaminyldiphosphoundecaprenol N-acetyl-beta-D-mannosaminyltransferase